MIAFFKLIWLYLIIRSHVKWEVNFEHRNYYFTCLWFSRGLTMFSPLSYCCNLNKQYFPLSDDINDDENNNHSAHHTTVEWQASLLNTKLVVLQGCCFSANF